MGRLIVPYPSCRLLHIFPEFQPSSTRTYLFPSDFPRTVCLYVRNDNAVSRDAVICWSHSLRRHGFKVSLYATVGLVIRLTGCFNIAPDYIQFTIVDIHVFTCRCWVLASNDGHSPSFEFPNCPRPLLPASCSSCSQKLNPNTNLTNSLINQLQQTNNILLTNCPAYNFSVRTEQETPSRFLFPVVAVQMCLLAKPLHSNGCCIYPVVVALQRAYIP